MNTDTLPKVSEWHRKFGIRGKAGAPWARIVFSVLETEEEDDKGEGSVVISFLKAKSMTERMETVQSAREIWSMFFRTNPEMWEVDPCPP